MSEDTTFLQRTGEAAKKAKPVVVSGAGGAGLSALLLFAWPEYQKLQDTTRQASEVPALKQQVTAQYQRFNKLEEQIAELKTKVAVIEATK